MTLFCCSLCVSHSLLHSPPQARLSASPRSEFLMVHREDHKKKLTGAPARTFRHVIFWPQKMVRRSANANTKKTSQNPFLGTLFCPPQRTSPAHVRRTLVDFFVFTFSCACARVSLSSVYPGRGCISGKYSRDRVFRPARCQRSGVIEKSEHLVDRFY